MRGLSSEPEPRRDRGDRGTVAIVAARIEGDRDRRPPPRHETAAPAAEPSGPAIQAPPPEMARPARTGGPILPPLMAPQPQWKQEVRHETEPKPESAAKPENSPKARRREVSHDDAEEGQIPQAAARPHDRQSLAGLLHRFRRLRSQGLVLRLDHRSADRSRPYRHDAFHQARRQSVDSFTFSSRRGLERSGPVRSVPRSPDTRRGSSTARSASCRAGLRGCSPCPGRLVVGTGAMLTRNEACPVMGGR